MKRGTSLYQLVGMFIYSVSLCLSFPRSVSPCTEVTVKHFTNSSQFCKLVIKRYLITYDSFCKQIQWFLLGNLALAMDPVIFPRVRNGTPGLGFLAQYKGGWVCSRETEALKIREKFVSGRTTGSLALYEYQIQQSLGGWILHPPQSLQWSEICEQLHYLSKLEQGKRWTTL